jgi:aerobic-type carbon monoxide dehydrogenase small subunit (CoxS/CutS family)
MNRTTEDVPRAGVAALPQQVEFTLNGIPVRTADDPDRSLLSVLRDQFGCTSLKNGCEPQASCGCCTLLIDGKARVSCTMKAKQVANKQVITLEGLPEKERTELADSFVACGGVQCGFCIPGMAMRGYSVVKDNPNPSRQQIAHELRGHVCRCTGYVKIVDAIEQFAQVRRGQSVARPEQSGKIGTALNRYRGRELVLGDFKYIDDIEMEGSLYAAMRFSDHPRARVRSIDATAALEIPGVIRVITAADVPGDRFVGLITKDWPIFIAEGE